MQLQEGNHALAHSLRVSCPRRNGDNVSLAVTAGEGGGCRSGIRSQEAEIGECWSSDHFLLSFIFIHSTTSAHGAVSLPFLGKSLQKHLHRYDQRCVSSVILNPVELTIEINHHNCKGKSVQTAQEIKMFKKFLIFHILFLKHFIN